MFFCNIQNTTFVLSQRGEGPIVLVLAPTRELACQIQVLVFVIFATVVIFDINVTFVLIMMIIIVAIIKFVVIILSTLAIIIVVIVIFSINLIIMIITMMMIDQEVAEQFGKSSRLKNTCVYGGAPKGKQVNIII